MHAQVPAPGVFRRTQRDTRASRLCLDSRVKFTHLHGTVTVLMSLALDFGDYTPGWFSH